MLAFAIEACKTQKFDGNRMKEAEREGEREN